MSLFNKFFASVGIGAAKVDTKLYQTDFKPGDEVKGVTVIKGGNVEQNVDEIYLSLMTTYIKESDDNEYNQQAVIDKFRITEPFTISAGEEKEIPFSFTLPLDTPATMGKTKVWIHTGLDIKNAIDPNDQDFIRVAPLDIVSGILRAAESLGFRLREVECEAAPYHLTKRLPFFQEFEFVPTGGSFRGRLDEIELNFFPQSRDTVEVIMQVDRRARGLKGLLSESLGMDESLIRFTVSSNDLPNLSEKLLSLLKRYS